ncbi:MAG: hypothetical protein A2Y33_12755 [Spirochaetes bacterium GWF1_51_8]|nr:MAG: hypothetical protein A2Y33_12755 [Spirochaetes bacterium GWF1_51_8]
MQSEITGILESLLPQESYEFGFADLTGLLRPEFDGWNYAISIAGRLNKNIVDSIADGPTREYFEHYHAVNRTLAGLLRQIAGELEKIGVRSSPVPPTVEDKYLDDEYFRTLRYPFSHKMAATRAGLGWIGKTDLFLSKRFGPRLRLSSLLIDTQVAPLSPPVDESLCGQCNLCADKCPAHAADGTLWNIRRERNEFYDPFKCRAFCRKISAERLGEEISLCGICVSVCPYGKGE